MKSLRGAASPSAQSLERHATAYDKPEQTSVGAAPTAHAEVSSAITAYTGCGTSELRESEAEAEADGNYRTTLRLGLL